MKDERRRRIKVFQVASGYNFIYGLKSWRIFHFDLVMVA